MLDFLGDYAAGEGVLKVQLLSKQELKVTNLEITEPTEYLDKYLPYKYGVIFRERLFVHNPEVFATFRLFLFRLPAASAEDPRQSAPPANPKDKKQPAGAKGAGGLSSGAIQGPQIDLEQARELDGFRSVYLELFEDDQLLKVVAGHNEAILFNVVLSGDRAAPRNYYLQARFELREVPEAASANEFTQNLYWGLSATSSDVRPAD